jgi:hypothetical protein
VDEKETDLVRLTHTALKHYASNAAARAAVVAIPWLGGGVDALLGIAGGNRRSAPWLRWVVLPFTGAADPGQLLGCLQWRLPLPWLAGLATAAGEMAEIMPVGNGLTEGMEDWAAPANQT